MQSRLATRQHPSLDQARWQNHLLAAPHGMFPHKFSRRADPDLPTSGAARQGPPEPRRLSPRQLYLSIAISFRQRPVPEATARYAQAYLCARVEPTSGSWSPNRSKFVIKSRTFGFLWRNRTRHVRTSAKSGAFTRKRRPSFFARMKARVVWSCSGCRLQIAVSPTEQAYAGRPR